jgi:hypothetical protein
MAKFNAETVKLLGSELFDYSFSDESAASVAHIIGAMASYSRRLHGIGLIGIQPPFGYPALRAEADRIRRILP